MAGAIGGTVYQPGVGHRELQPAQKEGDNSVGPPQTVEFPETQSVDLATPQIRC